ncbi:MAG: apolipoprotein N-acyltransferase [Bacteroidetes bacterium]|nr:apolipoprotein N-acyltransferase [Bacteroidota bacterium]
MKKFLNRFKTTDFWIRFLCGACFGLAFPPINFYPLIYLGIVLLIREIISSNSFGEVLKKTYSVFFWFNLIAISWICLSGFSHNAERYLIFAGLLALLAHPVFFWIPAAAFFKAYKNFRSEKFPYAYLITFPFIWTAFEYIHTLTQFSFPWLSFGNTQTYNLSKIQFIEFTGVYGLSFWICSVGALLFYLIEKIKSGEWKISSAKTIITVIIILAIYFAPDVYTLTRGSKAKYENAFTNGEISIGVVQPNSDPWERWGSKQMQFVTDYVDMIKQLKEKNPQTKLVILPETAITFYLFNTINLEKYLKIKNFVDSANTPLLVGLPYYKIYKDSTEAPVDAKRSNDGAYYDTFNAALLFEKNKTQAEYQVYKKNKLVIGGERVPYQEVLGFLKDYVTWQVGISQWQIGKDTNNFVLEDGTQFNTAICYESVYPEYFSAFVKKGADFCTIITNDGWWGKLFGTYQHNQYAVLRAIENRRWIARSANTGISEFIDPYGNKYNETAINERASFAGKIGIIKEKTFYTEHGDWLCRICLWISGAVLLFAIGAGLTKRTNRKT